MSSFEKKTGNLDSVYHSIGRPSSIVDDITNKLSEAIFEGKIDSGEQLIEMELQKALGVSRSPIREALLKLEGQGLVNIISRKGCFVRTITPVYIKEIFTVRAWLEGLAARLFSQKMTHNDLIQFEKILENMENLGKTNDFKQYFKKHTDFHMIFILGCQNSFLIKQIEKLRRQSLWLSYSITYFEKHFQKCQKIHHGILNTFKQKDPDQIEQAVRNHILDAIAYYVEYLKNVYPPNEEPNKA